MTELRRLFVPPEAFRGDRLELVGEQLHHARAVLRLRPGDGLTVTDGAGSEFRVAIERLGRETGSAVVLERASPQREAPLSMTLVQAVPRGDRFALVLEKAVELGVSAIRPVISGRTVRSGAGQGQATVRWRRIVEGALAQSGRTRLPELHMPVAWPQLVGDPGLPKLRLLLWEKAQTGLHAILDRQIAPVDALVAVGPEGGWSPAEVGMALQAGFLAVRLGPRILRTETAGLAALAVLQHRWGDLG